MSDLFTGDPLTTTSGTTSVTETPAWMQQAIYDIVNQSRMVAGIPYESYGADSAARQMESAQNRIAAPTAMQQQSWQNVQDNQNMWQPSVGTALSGLQQIASAPGTASAAMPALQQQADLLGQMAYNAPIQTAQQTSMEQANPYIQNAAQTSVANVQDYMNPYNEAVTDQIATLGARNLQENLLPAVSDSFIKAGSFGGTRMGEFGNRALRDTQEAVLGQQASALQQGYGQSLSASQADLARQAGLAGTTGQLASGDINRLVAAQQNAITQGLSGASQYGQMGQNMGMLTQSDLQQRQSALTGLTDAARQAQVMAGVDAGSLSAAGSEQQAYEQALRDAAYQQFQEQQIYPQQQLGWLNQQVQGTTASVPRTVTGTNTTTGEAYSPSPLAEIGAALSVVEGIM